MQRITDPEEFAALIDLNAPPGQVLSDFDPAGWLADPHVHAFRIDYDLAFFEQWWPNMARGHIWFHSRGIQAFRRARQILDHVASLGMTEILGSVPTYRKDVQRFVTGLGFKAVGARTMRGGNVIVFERCANQSRPQPMP